MTTIGRQRALQALIIILFITATFMGLSTQPSHAQAGEVLDQANEVGTFAGSIDAAAEGQTFTASVSGQLTRVEIQISVSYSAYDIAIQGVNAQGIPTDEVLATGSLAANQTGWVSIALTPQPSIVAGRQYAIILRGAPFRGGLYFAENNPSSYTRGTYITTYPGIWIAAENIDINFRTYVIPQAPTATPTNTATNTPVPPTATATATSTFTPVPPTATPTNTATNTSVPPTATPTNTPVPPTATATPTSTFTPVPPTATPTVLPGTVIATCGSYTVYQNPAGVYSAPGWTGAIKVGTNKNNTLTGTDGPDLMLGLGGNDKLDGKGGDDLLCGGDGVDLLQGLAGNDYLEGGSGNDVLNGGKGDYDVLVGADGNDTLLDGDGVRSAQGGDGNDLFTLAVRNGWRDGSGQPILTGIAGGYGNDTVVLAVLNGTRFLVDITGDERDNPPSPLEGNNDSLALAGVIEPSSPLIKFEHHLVLSADADAQVPSEEAGAEYLTEPVGEEIMMPDEQANRIFLPLISR